ncbi:MAG: nucleoside hydrolase [Blastocatellia bacterium]|nr:nucleoside hydrolase [Blastocatellia bacterium]
MKTRHIMLALSLTTFLGVGCRRDSLKNVAGQKPEANKTRTAVWIDTDPSVAPGGHEVDDGFALIQAFHSPELEIRGVSVVYGNAPFDTAWPIGQEIVRRFGPKGLPIYAGAARAEDLGVETAASRALAEALRKEKLTILSLGPVTNIATMLKDHPELSNAIAEIIAVAGRRPGQRFLARPEQKIPFRDFNFELDAPGFQVLLDSPAPLTLAPWEISSKVWLRDPELKRLAEGNEATRWLHPPAADWLMKWRKELGLDGFNPFDTLAIGYLTSPQLMRWEELPAEIRVLPDDVKQTNEPGGEAEEKPYLLVGGEGKAKRKVRYCFDVAPEFKEDLMTRLLR